MTPSDQTFASLTHHYGRRALAAWLNRPDFEHRDAASAGVPPPLSASEQLALGRLSEVSMGTDLRAAPTLSSCLALVSATTSDGTFVLDALRQQFYADTLPPDDSPVTALWRLAITALPLATLLSEDSGHGTSVFIISGRRPNAIADLMTELIQVFREANLLPAFVEDRITDGAGDDSQDFWVRSFAAEVASASIQLSVYRADAQHDLFDACKDIVASLARYRDAAELPAWHFFGLNNVALNSHEAVDTVYGTLHQYVDRMDPWVPQAVRPAHVQEEYRAGCTLEVRGVETDVLAEDGSTRTFNFDAGFNTDRMLEDVQLAFVLGIERSQGEPPVATSVRWHATVSPLAAHTWWSRPHDLLYGASPVRVTPEETREVVKFMRLLKNTADDGISLGRRRLLLALTRADPVDALIDAVLVWEVLYPGQGERLLRVKAGLALTLETDYLGRTRVAKEAADLYGKRSRLVHGNPNAKDQDPAESRIAARQALGLAIAAMRTLYERAPCLLTSTTNASERFDRLIYEGGLPTQGQEPER